MEVQLRPSARRIHPLMKPMYRRAGFSGLGLTPGYTPAQQAMADSFRSQFGAPAPAVYQAPTQVPVPACTQDTRPGGAAFSQGCIDQLLAAQQQNMAAHTAANYDVDRANCETDWATNDARYRSLGIPGPPNTCAQRTFGLTLPGTTGGTNILTPSAPVILDPNYAGPGSAPAAATPPPATGGTPALSFTNLTSGDNSNFKVGDRWQVRITGASPNAAVSVSGGQNGANGTSGMGSTDSSGTFLMNGQISADQVGSWRETWNVGNAPAGSFSFTVAPVGSSSSSVAKPPATQSIFGALPGGSVDIGGMSVPWLAIGGGVLLVVLLVMRK